MRKPVAPIDTIRTPDKAEDLKARLVRLSNSIATLRSLRRNFEHTFYQIGEILREIQASRLFEVKGYSTLESFLDRETEIGSSAGARALQAISVFRRQAAEAAGFARVASALRALDGDTDQIAVHDRDTPGRRVPPHKL